MVGTSNLGSWNGHWYDFVGWFCCFPVWLLGCCGFSSFSGFCDFCGFSDFCSLCFLAAWLFWLLLLASWLFGMCGFLAAILAWEPVPGNLACDLYLGTCSWEPCLETLLGNLFLGTLLGGTNLLGTLLANLFLGTCFGNLFLETWEPLLGSLLEKEALSWEPGSQPILWDLLRPAPGPLLWLKTPSLRCWGTIQQQSMH